MGRRGDVWTLFLDEISGPELQAHVLVRPWVVRLGLLPPRRSGQPIFRMDRLGSSCVQVLPSLGAT